MNIQFIYFIAKEDSNVLRNLMNFVTRSEVMGDGLGYGNGLQHSNWNYDALEFWNND